MLAVGADPAVSRPLAPSSNQKTVTFKLEPKDYGSMDFAQLSDLAGSEPKEVMAELSKRIGTVYPGSSNYMSNAQSIVSVLERIKWQEAEEEEEEFKSFSKLLVNLATVCPSLVPTLFRLILIDACNKRTERTEELIQTTIRLVPSSTSALLTSLEYNFPYYSRPAEQMDNYLKLLLELMRRVPTLRPKLLDLIIDKFLTIDVAIQKESLHLPDELDVIQEEERNGDDEQESESSDDGDLEALDSDLLRRSTSPVALNMADLMTKLDSGLVQLFEYFNGLKESPEELRSVFAALMRTFERAMLPTFRSRCVPFVLFYVASLSPNLTDVFLGFLMKRLYHVFDQPGESKKRTGASTASLLTVVTASYIASFVARAKFLPEKFVRLSFDMLLTWCLRFLGDLPSHLRSGVKALRGGSTNLVSERTAVFYAVSQAVMYIFCFRHRSLMHEHEGQDLNSVKAGYRNFILPILQSPLNPLKWCMSAVVEEFTRLTEHYDLVDCKRILDRSSRRSAPPMSSADVDVSQLEDFSASTAADQTGSLLGDLDSYFPFDPLILKAASAFISADLYNEWTNEDLVDSEEEEEEDSEVEDSDDASFSATDDVANRDLLFSHPVWQGLAVKR